MGVLLGVAEEDVDLVDDVLDELEVVVVAIMLLEIELELGLELEAADDVEDGCEVEGLIIVLEVETPLEDSVALELELTLVLEEDGDIALLVAWLDDDVS